MTALIWQQARRAEEEAARNEAERLRRKEEKKVRKAVVLAFLRSSVGAVHGARADRGRDVSDRYQVRRMEEVEGT